MKIIFKIIYATASVIFLLYLLIPTSKFPEKPEYSLQSSEPADIESFYRRGYYVNGDRNKVVDYYRKIFDNILFFNKKLKLYSLRLNYPPEESQTIIRDQTRSTYLEEIVHPFRESLYINGFEPKKDNDMIVVGGKNYEQKVIVKLVTSSLYVRFIIGLLSVISGYIVILFWMRLFQKNKNDYGI